MRKKLSFLVLALIFVLTTAHSQTYVNVPNPTLTGVNLPDTPVDVYFDGSKVGTTTTDAAGQWAWPLSGIPEGTYNYYAIAVQQLIVDMTKPQPPHINPPQVDCGTDLKPCIIPVNGCITGTGEPGATITAYVDGVKHGTTIVGTDGKWQYCFVPPLTPGIHEICFDQTDRAGNISDEACIKVDAKEDTTPPEPPTIDDPNSPVTPDECISGTGEAGATATIFVDGVVHGTTIVGADGKWRYCFDPQLPDGPHDICVDLTDAAGNTSTQTCVPIVVDGTDPADPTIDDPNGPIKPDDCITGTGEAGTTATIYVNGVVHGTTIVGTDGKWRYCFDPELPAGDPIICVELTDAAGNTSGQTCKTIEVDDTPEITVTVKINATLDACGMYPVGPVKFTVESNIPESEWESIHWVKGGAVDYGYGNTFSFNTTMEDWGPDRIYFETKDGQQKIVDFNFRFYDPSYQVAFETANQIVLARGVYVGDNLRFKINFPAMFADPSKNYINISGPSGNKSFKTDGYYTVTTPGNHTANATIKQGCYDTSLDQQFTVHPLPTDIRPIQPTCSSNGRSSLNGNATPNSVIVISWDDTFASYSTNSEGKWQIDLSAHGLSIDNLDSHNVVLHNIVNTFQLTKSYVDGLADCGTFTGLSSVAPTEIVIVPNPVQSTFFVNGLEDKAASIEVLSITGSTLIKSANTDQIDASKLAKGTYVVKVTSKEGAVLTKKLIKK